MKTILTILFNNFKSNKSTFIVRQIKPFTLLFGLLLFFGLFSISSAQVIEGSVYLTTQEEVNSFTGTSITDSLIISGSDIVDLSPLSTLDSVGGDLNIYGNNSLTNLDGLSNLTSVRGSLNVGMIEGEGEHWLCCLPKGNPELTNLDGLSNLSSVDSSLSIIFNDALTNLDGLSNLTSVGNIGIGDNDALTNLDGLSNLTSVGNLGIGGNDALTNLDGLSNITSVGGDLHIGGMDLLTNLDGLSNLASVGGVLIINDIKFTNLDGLTNLTSVGRGLSIFSNDFLKNLDGLSNLASVGGDLGIWENSTLSSFCGLYMLLSTNGLGGEYRVSDNLLNPTQQKIIDGGACNEQVIEGDVILHTQAQVDSFAGSFISGHLVIEGSDIDDLTALSTLDSVGGDLLIYWNESLTNLDGLNHLTSVGGSLNVGISVGSETFPESYEVYLGNPELTNLDGLSSLTSVDSGLYILSNDALINLDGLRNLTSVGDYLAIKENSALSDFCGLYMLLSTNGLVGDYIVNENLVNPTQQEIIDGEACLTAIGENELFPKHYELHQNYPNPFNPSTTIEFDLPKSEFVELKVFNILGKEVSTILSNKLNQGNHSYQFDGKTLASGIYYYQLVAGEYKEVKKMILIK